MKNATMRRPLGVVLLTLFGVGASCAKATLPDSPIVKGGDGGDTGVGGTGGAGVTGGGSTPTQTGCDGVDCSDLDSACSVGQCDPADGACKALPIAEGAPCDDDDRCTLGDKCNAGACTGAPADCSAAGDGCHIGMCNPANGTCAAVAVADGTSCEDAYACSTGDTCASGVCVAGAAVDCSTFDGECRVGQCNPATGTCRAVATAPGGACDDESLCSWSDVCIATGCRGTVIDCDVLGISFPQVSDTPVRGNATESTFLDDCPYGQVPIGVEASVATGARDGLLTNFATQCGAVSLVQTATGVNVSVSAGARVPTTGGRGTWSATTGSVLTQVCPANQVAVGFEGATEVVSGKLTQLALRCAPLTVTGASLIGYTIALGTAAATPAVGTAPGTPIPATNCPSGTVARGSIVRADELLNAYGLHCGAPTLRLSTTAPSLGHAGSTPTEEDCPAGQVPIGIESKEATAYYSGILTGYATLCGTVTVTAVGGTFDVRVGPGSRLPASGSHGSWTYTTGTVSTATCPSNQVVVGLAGTMGGSVSPGDFTTQISLRCAPFTVSGDATSGYAVSVGTITELSPVGHTFGTASPARDCPAGMVGRGFYVSSGEILDGLALRCAEPAIHPL